MHRTLTFLSLILVSLLIAACTGGTEAISVGADAPAFSLSSAEGDEISLADYEGTPVLLFFHMAVG